MQITLNQDEINDAIENYVRDQITINDNQVIEIDMKAGRGENGNSAIIDIRPVRAAATKAPKPSFKTRAAAAKPQVEDAVDEAEESSNDIEEEQPSKPAEKPVTESKTSTIFGKVEEPTEEAEEEQAEDDQPASSEETEDKTESEAPSRNSIFSKKAG